MLQVARARAPGDVEAATTENVSSRGARVLTGRPIPPGEQVLVGLRGGGSAAEARVIYCLPLRGGRFGVGLQFRSYWAW